MFVLVGSLIVVVLFAALIAPYFIDWSSYKKDFEEQASRIVGQRVTVTGDADVRILPLPSLSFSGLEVGRNEDGSPMMTVDRFSLNAELMPFLSGEVRIVDMKLVRPAVNVSVSEEGTIAWTAREESLLEPGQVTLDKVQIENGSIRIDGLAGGRALVGEQLFADVSARSLLGPWKIDAEGFVDGVSTRLSISTGTAQDDGSVRVKAEGYRLDLPYRMVADGAVALEEGILGWTGSFNVDAINPNENAARLFSELEALPINVEGQFAVSPKQVVVPQYRMEIGDPVDPYTITGTGTVNIQEETFFRVEADGRQIDLDRLGEGEGNEARDAPSIEQRLRVVEQVLNRIPVPSARGEFDIILPAVVAGDTFIREVTAKVRPNDSNWEVRNLSAIFPGNTTVEARGFLGVGDDFGFTGKLTLASRQPSGLAAWLGADLDDPVRRLRNAGFASDVTISENQATFEALELVLDGDVLSGDVRRVAPVDGRPALIARLEGERINLDNLQAIYTITQARTRAMDQGIEGGEAGEGSEGRPGARTTLTNHDLDVHLKAELLEGIGLAARDVDTRFKVSAGEVSVEALNVGEFFGASIRSNGRLQNLLGQPSGNLKLTLESPNPSRLLQLAENRLDTEFGIEHLYDNPALLAPTNLSVEVEAREVDEGSAGQVLVDGLIGGSKVQARIGFDGRIDKYSDIRLDISSQLTNSEPLVLLRQFAIPVRDEVLEGPLDVSADFVGTASDGLSTRMVVLAANHNLSANGLLTRVVPEEPGSAALSHWLAEFQTSITSDNLLPLLAVAGLDDLAEDVPSSLPTTLDFNLEHGPDETRFEGLRGQINGNALKGAITLVRPDARQPKFMGELALNRLSLELLAGLATGTFDETIEGLLDRETLSQLSVDGDLGESFGVSRFAGHDADIRITADKAGFADWPPLGAFAARLMVLNGVINLNDVSAEWLGGNINAEASVRNTDGSLSVSSQYQISDMRLLPVLDVLGISPTSAYAPSGLLDGQGTLEAMGRSVDGLLSGLAGSGVLTLEDGVVRGINLDGFDALLAASDREGFELEDSAVSALGAEVFTGGQTAVKLDREPYSISRGKLAMRNLQHADDRGLLAGSLSIDLADDVHRFDVAARLDPGKEAVAGAEPQLGVSIVADGSGFVVETDSAQLQAYLSIRAFEREQRRVEMLQAGVLEKQRLRREVILTNTRMRQREAAREAERVRIAEELRKAEEEQRRLEEEARQKAEAERQRREEEARRMEQERLEREAAERAREAERQRVERERQEAEARRQQQLERSRRKAEEAFQRSQEQTFEEQAPQEQAPREQESSEGPVTIIGEGEGSIIQKPLAPAQNQQPDITGSENGDPANTTGNADESNTGAINPDLFRNIERFIID